VNLGWEIKEREKNKFESVKMRKQFFTQLLFLIFINSLSFFMRCIVAENIPTHTVYASLESS
jgi:hypothetical protein